MPIIPFKERVTDAHRETAKLILEWYCSPFKNSPSALAECARLIAHKEAEEKAVVEALSKSARKHQTKTARLSNPHAETDEIGRKHDWKL